MHTARFGRNIDTGFDGHDHARLKQAPLIADFVITDIVNVHPDPVPGAVHEVLTVCTIFNQLWNLALEEAELDKPFRDDGDGCIVGVIPGVALARFVDRCELCFENDVVDRALFRREFAIDRNRARDVGRVVVAFTTRIDEQQVTVFELAIVIDVVKCAGICAAANDRAV